MEQTKRFRVLSLLLALLLLCTACLTASAEEAQTADAGANQDFEIRGTTLVKYTGPGGKVTVPDGIERIADDAFDSSAVTKVFLPSSLKEIGHHSFFNCYSLTEITLPAALENLEDKIQAFGCNPSLRAIGVSEDNPNYVSVDGVVFTADRKTLVCYPDGKNPGGSYAIPEGTVRLAQTAFNEPSLVSLTLPSTLIDKGGVENSFIIHSLEEINVAPGNIKYYSKDGVLYSATALVSYPAQKKTKELKPEDFPEGLKTVGADAFWGNSYIESIVLPDGLEGIGGKAFLGLSSLKTCLVPESVKYIGHFAFADCTSLERVTILNPDVEQPELDREDPRTYNLFWDANQEAVLCAPPGGRLEEYAKACGLNFEPLDPDGNGSARSQAKETPNPVTDLRYFEIDGTTLKRYVGYEEVVTVPDFITELGEEAFSYTPVKKVILPEGLKEIRSYCFSDCADLEDITLPASLENLEYSIVPEGGYQMTQAQVFCRNPKLKEIKVAEGNLFYKSVDGVLFTADGRSLLYFPDGKNPQGSYAIPEGTRSLGYTAFGDPQITAVYVPATLRNVLASDFSMLKALKEINVHPDNPEVFSEDGILYDKQGNLLCYPGGKTAQILEPEDLSEKMKRIENYAFEGNRNLVTVTLPEGLQEVGYMSFRCSRSLETVTIPASVHFIGNYAFADCYALKRVTVLNPWAEIEKETIHKEKEYNLFWDSNPQAVLCGYEGSTAQQYAEEYNIPFESLGPAPKK